MKPIILALLRTRCFRGVLVLKCFFFNFWSCAIL